MSKKSIVVFFPMKFFPSYTVLEELKLLQFEFRKFHQDIERDCKDGYELAVRKQQMVNLVRSKIKVIDC